MKKSAARARSTNKKKSAAKPRVRKWSRKVTERSDALDLQKGVFTKSNPKEIAASLKRSAERSKRRKADPYRSAHPMLTFCINRAGSNLPAGRKKKLMQAKTGLHRQFERA